MRKKKNKKENIYWRNLKNHYPLILPHTFALFLGYLIVYAYIQSWNIIQSINNPNPLIIPMYGILFIMGLFKILEWVGYDIIIKWADNTFSILCTKDEKYDKEV